MSVVLQADVSCQRWRSVKLGDILMLINGRAYKKDEERDSGTPVLRIQNLNGGDRWFYSDLSLPENKYCEKGDLLFAWSATFGPYIWWGEKVIYHYHIWKIECGPELDKKFAYYLLQHITERVKAAGRGISMIHMTKGGMEDWDVSIPPLDEQKRIAAILDQADELRRKRQRAIARLNQIDQAIFFEMFGTSNKDAREELLGSLTTKIGSGATPKGGDSAYKVSGTPLIRSMNVRDGHFLEKGLAYIDDEQAKKLNNVIVREDDVLLNITGASVARVCRAPKQMDGARVNQHVSIIRPTGQLTSEFLEAFLLMPQTKTRLLTIAESGATRQAITKAQIEELLIPVPSLQKQLEFAARVRLAKSSQSAMAEQSRSFDQLFSSLQHRAFQGEL
jgi:type I restriction enzyme S subunit